MVSTLREQGASVQVLCLTQGECWEAPIKNLGVPIIWVGQSSSRLWRAISVLRTSLQLRPDVIQSAHFYTNLYAALAGRFLGIPAIGAMRSNCLKEVADNGKWLGMMQLKTPHLIAGNSVLGIQNARSLGIPENHLFFLPNLINLTYFSTSDRRIDWPISILTAGNMTKAKRTDCFIRLIARLHQQEPGRVKGLIAGDGPLRAELEQQAQEAGLLPAQLIFLGRVDGMQEVYARASIFVLTSAWEGTPNVVMEAMACGLPVVATAVGGVPDLLQPEETGLLVDEDNEEQLFQAVSRLIHNPKVCHQLGDRARAYMEKHHGLGILPQYLETLYRLVLTGAAVFSF